MMCLEGDFFGFILFEFHSVSLIFRFGCFAKFSVIISLSSFAVLHFSSCPSGIIMTQRLGLLLLSYRVSEAIHVLSFYFLVYFHLVVHIE